MTTVGVRHVLGISGGKDSAALAIYLRDRVPEMEYFFCDTHKELPETYEFINKLEAVLGKPIKRLSAEFGFDHYLKLYHNYLPSPKMRWCTRQLKLKPFEEFVGNDPVLSYVAIRADEDRSAYVSTKPNIQTVFPFKDDGIKKADVLRILDQAGVGLPAYYSWRTRSGCSFCFFQRKSEWVGLKEHHPELFEAAKSYEKVDPVTGVRYSWQTGETLAELEIPARVKEIKDKEGKLSPPKSSLLVDAFDDLDDDERACAICDV